MISRFSIAIDGGGTGTRAGLYDESRKLLKEVSGAATNPAQIGIAACVARIAALVGEVLVNHACDSYEISIGLSGARTDLDRDRVASGVCSATSADRVLVTTDVHAQLLGNAGRIPTVLVVAGTGSSVAVFDDQGVPHLFGGRGPILGDDGSAYHVVVSALRYGCHKWDVAGEPPDYVETLAMAAGLSAPEELVTWSVRAAKNEIAALAPVLLGLAESNDGIRELLSGCLMGLASHVKSAIDALGISVDTPVYVTGGMFESGRTYIGEMKAALERYKVKNPCELAPIRSHQAVLTLSHTEHFDEDFPVSILFRRDLALYSSTIANHSATELLPLEQISALDTIVRMTKHNVEASVSVAHAKEDIALLVTRVADAFKKGGRLAYVGAGTSGRIGVLDASECPPTFGVPPGQVIGIIAGGDRALRESIEGAEDDADLGRSDIDAIDPPIGKDDVVVGIAASGTTPYTLAAVEAAKARGATTALVCCNPNAKVDVDHLLLLPTGPEVLPGSTRLKAGTATKMVLNAISTGAMALSGRVFDGYMIGVQPTNNKLRKRAAQIVSALTGIDEKQAAQRLKDAGDNVAAAVLMERLKISAADAYALLERTRGDVRAAIALHTSGRGE